MAVVIFCVVVFWVTVGRGQTLDSQNQRPLRDGTSGERDVRPLIPAGKPWPSDIDDNDASFGTISSTQKIDNIPLITKKMFDHNAHLITEYQETSTSEYEERNTFKPNALLESIGPLEIPKSKIPPSAGLTIEETPSHIIPPGKTWPIRREDHEEFIFTSPEPQLVDRFKNTTTVRLNEENKSIDNQIIGSSRPITLPKLTRPSFAGQTGGGKPPQTIQPGKPWPSRPEDYGEFSATSLKPQLVDRFKETTMRPQGDGYSTSNQMIGSSGPPKLPKPSRPSFAGQTGGGTPPQTIQPGKPWPSKPEDYGEFSATSLKPQLVDRFKETTMRPQGDGYSTSDQMIGSSGPPKLPKPSRPSFAGQTGGGTPPQTIQPGKPWPSKPEDYGEFIATSLKPQLVDRFKETTMRPQGDGYSTSNQMIGSSRPPKLPKPGRPSFAGQTGGGTPPQTIQPGKPWSSKPEDYGEFSATSLKPQLVDRFKETTMRPQGDGYSTSNQMIGSSRPPKLPKPSRPSFAGQTGGGTPPQTIQPGKPWPSKPEDYVEFSATSLKPQLVDRFKETTMRPQGDGYSTSNQMIGSSRPPKLPKPGRPSFAGQTGGGTPPQTIQPGKPWSSKPEDYGEFSATTLKPQLIDRLEETATMKPQGDGDSTPNQVIGSSGPPKLPKPSRPSFAGQTEGGTPPQTIQPGKPWPSKPEDYGEFSATTLTPQSIDRFEETATKKPQGDGDSTSNPIIGSSGPQKLPKPSRPSFSGQTGGGTPPQIIQPGKPWPFRPEDYGEFSATTLTPQLIDRFEETATKKPQGNGDTTPNQIIVSSGPQQLPKPSRPSFAGQTGGGAPSQTIQPGKPWPSKPEDYGEFSATTLKPQLIDRFEETATKNPQGDGDSTSNLMIGSSGPPKLPKPSRPSFAGLTGGRPPSQIIPPGKPWPARPQDYEGFSVTSRKPQLADKFKETTKLQKVNISETLKSIVQPERVLPPSSHSIKPWPTKQAEEMMTKIKDEIFFSKKVSNSSPIRPEVNNLLLVDSPFFRKIFKSNNPWHVSQKIVEDSTPELLSFRPEDNPFTSAPSTRFIRV